jgi:hypothetical protein
MKDHRLLTWQEAVRIKVRKWSEALDAYLADQRARGIPYDDIPPFSVEPDEFRVHHQTEFPFPEVKPPKSIMKE